MGKVARWFKGLFGTKKSKERQSCDDSGENVILSTTCSMDTEKEQSKNSLAVSTATASATETAVSAAETAAEGVGLTSEGRAGDMVTREERWAVVTIQKVFRGSLARKALRALKGIVKLQALVRGFLVRKRAAAMLESIQTLMRVQTAMRSERINRCLSKEYSKTIRPRQSIDKFDEAADDERSPKIVEMDDIYKRRSISRSKSRHVQNVVAMSEYEDDFDYHGNDLELHFPVEKRKFPTAQSTPRFSFSSHHPSGNNRYYGMQSPATSVGGSALCDYGMSTPGYMEKTQSFKAKLRSHSAPKQRSERKRLSLDEVMASRSSDTSSSMVQPQRYSCSYDPI